MPYYVEIYKMVVITSIRRHISCSFSSCSVCRTLPEAVVGPRLRQECVAAGTVPLRTQEVDDTRFADWKRHRKVVIETVSLFLFIHLFIHLLRFGFYLFFFFSVWRRRDLRRQLIFSLFFFIYLTSITFFFLFCLVLICPSFSISCCLIFPYFTISFFLILIYEVQIHDLQMKKTDKKATMTFIIIIINIFTIITIIIVISQVEMQGGII